MATKSQLKQYFETGKIPTQAQFGELIDFIQPSISDNVINRPNQTLLFGGDTPNPIINGLRIVHYYENDDTIYNYWIFTNEAGGNNQSDISIPMFVIKRISSKEPNLSLDMPNLEYAIPTKEQLTNWVQRGYDCDTAGADTLHSALTHLTFKPWPEGGGSEFPRIAYIDGQDAWDNWYIQFKKSNPGNGNGGGSGSTILNEMIIDGYTFIIKSLEGINFQGTETLEFINCTIINNDIIQTSIIMNFNNCVFRNCHITNACSISNGEFNNCSLLIDGNIDHAFINYCSLHGNGIIYSCNIRDSDVRFITLEAGNIEYSDIADCMLGTSISLKSCKLHSCIINSAKFSSAFIEMIGCSSTSKMSFNGSASEIKGFIFGCDFKSLESIPGVMKGAQCCKFKSTLLSSGVIKADLFGDKSAETNGMNTGV